MQILVAQCILVLLAGSCVFADLSNCENSPSHIWRNEGETPIECPEKAVCGDEWTMIRDWRNGARCLDQRVVYNCRCSGADRPCPVGDDDYALHASQKHKQYLCQPACEVEMCSSNVRAAQEMVDHFRDDDRLNYYRINCRCPGHGMSDRSHPGRSTTFRRLYWDFVQGVVYHQYVCSRGGRSDSGNDWCSTR